MLGNDILVGVFGNAAYEIIKCIVTKVFGIGNKSLSDQAYNAFKTSYDIFFKKYNDKFGSSSHSFLSSQKNLEIILNSVFYSSKILKAEHLCYSSINDFVEASDDAVAFFVDTFEKEMRKDYELDKILTEKEHIIKSANEHETMKEMLKVIETYIKEMSEREIKSYPSVLERWSKYAVNEYDALMANELENHREWEISPLSEKWDTFIMATPWHIKVESQINKLLKTVNEHIQLRSKYIWEIEDYKLDVNYCAIQEELKKIIVKFKNEMNQLPKESEEEYRYLSFKTNKHDNDNLEKSIEKLEKMLEEPDFRRCFLVMGSLGSGKTHFISTLLKNCEKSIQTNQQVNFLLIRLKSMMNYSNFEDIVLKSINQALGIKWNSLEEINNLLDEQEYTVKGSETRDEESCLAQKVKLVIAVDDLQNWIEMNKGFRKEFTEYISKNTHLHSIYWLITLQDNGYGMVKQDNTFWLKYGDISKKIYFESSEILDLNIGGWTVLDVLNRKFEISLNILSKVMQINVQKFKERLKLSKFNVYRLTPFVAWVLVDLNGEIYLDNIVNLVYIDFVKKFWEKRCRFLYEILEKESAIILYTDNYRTVLDNVIIILSNYFIKTASFKHLYSKLENIIIEEGAETDLRKGDLAHGTLRVLEKGGLLRFVEEHGENLGKLKVPKLEISFEIFWEYQIAQQLIPEYIKNGDDFKYALGIIDKWFEVTPSNIIREEVLEFLILLLEDKINDVDPKLINKLLSYIFTSSELPSTSVWFACAKASDTTQRYLANMIMAGKITDIKNNLYPFMYFLVEASSNTFEEISRLKVLQPYYKDIQINNLSPYFEYLVGRLFDKIDDNRIVFECIKRFVGCEVMKITENLAEMTVNVLFRNANQDCEKVTRLVLNFINFNKKKILESSLEKREIPYYYYQWFLCKFCGCITRHLGASAYDLFYKVKWYKADILGIKYPISLWMKQAANMALGFWYKKYSTFKKDTYINLVNKLTHSEHSYEREIAFYLIRHSASTGKGMSYYVDKEFNPMLKHMFISPNMKKLVKHYYAFFKKNLKSNHPEYFKNSQDEHE